MFLSNFDILAKLFAGLIGIGYLAACLIVEIISILKGDDDD
jgi:hypothetical protein